MPRFYSFATLARRMAVLFCLCITAAHAQTTVIDPNQPPGNPEQGLVADSTELRVLLQLYQATGGTEWADHTNWGEGESLDAMSTWFGVKVGDGDVVRLELPKNQLSGELPAALGLLAGLTSLDVYDNALTGTLPAALAQCTRLQNLSLGGNQFRGALPADWGTLTQLQGLNAAGNRLTGPLPELWGRLATLYRLELSDNQLVGTLSDSLAGLAALQQLGLANNHLTGSLQPLVGMTHLQSVNAAGNRFSGALPTGLGQLADLNYLYLDNNALSGALPASLGQLPQLYHLTLAGNHFSGTLPASVLRMPSLYLLRLNGSDLTGIEDLSGATGLRVSVDVSGNFLDFASLERLFQGAAQPRCSFVDARWQRASLDVDTVRYYAGGELILSRELTADQHPLQYQWQRLVSGQWVNLPGDTAPTRYRDGATAAEQGTYRRAVHNGWFTNPALAPTELYSAMVYADMLPYQPLARNRPVDANQGLALATPLPAPDASAPAPADMNFVRTWVPREAITAANRVALAPVDSVSMSTQYLDGLGRPVQTVLWQASPQHRDLVQPQAYDALGQKPQQFLPYPDSVNGPGTYRVRALTDQQAFYYRTGPRTGGIGPLPATDPIVGVARTGAAFAETLFEASPLNRVVAQGAAGEAWQVSSGHVVERQERPNTAADSVLRFAPGYDPAVVDPGYQGFYAPGELWGTDVADVHGPSEAGAHGYRTVEWKDKEGQVVLRQVEAARTGTGANLSSRWLRTAYAYDDFGRLRYVVQPEGTKRLLSLVAGTAVPAPVVPFLFHYRYDGRGRQIAKQVPGTDGETVVVFDQLDRPVLSQDAAQRGRREWSWTKYDALGRIILSGLIVRGNTDGQVELQALANADTLTAHQYEQRTANGGTYPYFYTTDQSFPRFNQQGFGPGLVLSIMHYDDYNFDNDAAGIADVAYNSSTDGQFPSGQAPVADAWRTTGLPTRTKTRVLGVDAGDPDQADWLTTTTFYDERARPVQVQATNARKDKDKLSHQQYTDLLTTRLDFTGKVVQSVAVHEGPKHTPVTVAEFFTYDHTGRLLTTRQQLPGEAQPSQVASVAYNEIGQATQKTMGTGRLAQTVKYAYNIRGWLTSLNDPYQPQANDLFNLSLHYERGFTPGYEQYNGNLTGQTWRGRDGVQRAYGYVYDPLNRLLQGDFVARNGGATGTTGLWKSEEDNYRLAFASYDDNGNLLTLRRRGLLANATHATAKQFGPVDELTYAYQGNRLQAVDDAVNTNQLPRPLNYNGAPTSLAGDFQEGGTHLGQEYLYDANGNLTQDRNKGITGIAYNHLNLPRQIHFGYGADSLVFRYTAAGQKVAKLVYQTGKPVLRTDYLGPYQYEQDSLRFFPHAEGRVLRFANTTSGAVRYEREFTFKDHLGNLRLAYRLGQVRTLTATLEQDASTHTRESQQFDSLSVSPPTAVPTGLARTGAYAARLNAGGSAPRPLGPLTQFAVQKGDTVRATAFGLYPQATSSNSFAFSLAGFIASLLQPAPTAPAGVDGTRRGGLPLLQVGLSSATLLALNQLPGGVPKGYLRVLSFNEDSVLVDQRTVQLRATALNNYDTLQTGPLVVQQNGYVSVYVGNESAADVYFDDVTIEHRQGLQVQENQYDPFGLDLAGVSGAAPGLRLKNFYQFNGKENQLDLGLNWNHQDWRFFDYQIGRWHVVDPHMENYVNITPYSYVANNPINHADPDGRDIHYNSSSAYNKKTGVTTITVTTDVSMKLLNNSNMSQGDFNQKVNEFRSELTGALNGSHTVGKTNYVFKAGKIDVQGVSSMKSVRPSDHLMTFVDDVTHNSPEGRQTFGMADIRGKVSYVENGRSTGTMMHEFGHNMGLLHNWTTGDTHDDNKGNYMSYEADRNSFSGSQLMQSFLLGQQGALNQRSNSTTATNPSTGLSTQEHPYKTATEGETIPRPIL